MNPHKAKGDRAEREVEALLRELLDDDGIRRALGAGRKDDVGDIHGVADTTVQVVNYQDIGRAILLKLPELEAQQANARARFAALFVRRRGGRYVVVMTPEMWADLWKASQ